MNTSLLSNAIETLNKQFGLPGKVEFKSGANNEFIFCELFSDNSKVSICLYGAHVTEYQVGEKQLLWLSPDAVFEQGKSIRGGIPLCWPWFGPHPNDSDKPNHGFARNQLWDFVGAQSNGDCVAAKLELRDNELTKKLFEFEFRLTLEIELSNRLCINLTATNESTSTMEVGAALHSYFKVDDVSCSTVAGLENVRYLDQLDNHAIKKDNASVSFDREVDRIYLDSNSEVLMSDSKSEIIVGKSGSCTTVVWNPWIEKASRMSDMPDDAYKSFVCIEAANAFDDVRRIEPGASHVISQTIQLVKELS